MPRESWFAFLPLVRAPPPPRHPASPATAHLSRQAVLCPRRHEGIRPSQHSGRRFRPPFPADEAVVITAGEGPREVQGQPCLRVCRHHTPPSRQHATCCFCSRRSHFEPACAQSMKGPHAPNSFVHAPVRVPYSLHDHGIRAHLPDHRRSGGWPQCSEWLRRAAATHHLHPIGHLQQWRQLRRHHH
jgi:hypothetical protein